MPSKNDRVELEIKAIKYRTLARQASTVENSLLFSAWTTWI
jgi:hypothetical protein